MIPGDGPIRTAQAEIGGVITGAGPFDEPKPAMFLFIQS
jgi:hypothetical protein